jgi:hypothetical protein
VGLLLHPPKSDDKFAQKSVQLVSSFRSAYKIHTLGTYYNWMQIL